MCYKNFLQYVSVISKRDDIPREEKEKLLKNMKEQFMKIISIGDIIVDTKFGIKKQKNEQAYNESIDDAIKAANKANEMYREQFGADMFLKVPNSAVDLLDVSAEIDKDMFERIEKEENNVL